MTDVLYQGAVKMFRELDKVIFPIVMLKQRFGIDYARACGLIAEMEKHGVLGPIQQSNDSRYTFREVIKS